MTAPQWGEAVVPDAGICESSSLPRTTHWSSKGEQGTKTVADVKVNCYSPQRRVGIEVRAELQSDKDELSWERPFAPFPASAGFSPLELTSTSEAPISQPMPSIVTYRPVAYIERRFQTPTLRMRDYAFH